jgi:pimeloyl-ACP methyl ester carboxylesterase
MAGRQQVIGGTLIRFVQEGAGPDVLLVHGSPGSLEDWEPIRARLAPRFRVTAFDRPGQGYSGGADRPHSVEDNARVVLDLVHALGLHDVVYVGHSFGGAVGLHLAVSNPDEVRRFVLVGSKSYPPVAVEPLYRVLASSVVGRGLGTVLAPLVGPARIEAGVRASFGPNADAIPSDFVARRVPLWTRPAVVAALAEERAGFEASLAAQAPHYGEIRKGVVIVCGEQDRNHDEAARLAREIPGARLVMLPDTGHYVAFARPDALAAIVAEAAQ